MHNDFYVPGQDVKLKIAVYGPSQVGKSHFGLSAPGPVVMFDAEGSLDALARKFPDARGVKKGPDRVKSAIDTLKKAMSGAYGEACGSFVLDSWTLLENDVRSEYEHPNDPLSHHAINSRIEQHLMRALEGPTSVHLVVTARDANEWNTNIRQGTIGFRPDAHKQFEHAFDLIFRISIDKQTKERTAQVYKTRYPEIFKRDSIIKNLSWAHFEPILRGDVKARDESAPMAKPPTVEPAPATDAPTMVDLTEKYKRAGSPSGTLGVWLNEMNLVTDGKVPAPNRKQAAKMLDELVALA